MELEYRKMVYDLAKPGREIFTTLTATRVHTIHMILGIVGESREVAQEIENLKNIEIKDIEPTSKDDLIKELGDLEFYLEGLCQGVKFVLRSEINKQIIKPYDKTKLMSLCCMAAEDIKKYIAYNKMSPTKDLYFILKKVREEIDFIYAYFSISREEVLKANMKKLSVRYEGFKYSDKQALEKRDKNETKI